MSTQKVGNKPIAFIRELCKHKTEVEILEAEENFRQYLMLIKRMCERMEQDESPSVDIDKAEKYCDS
ncbi:MAG: hypothetical protein JSS76_00505 [Bacteroidetes bacterium]|nr:hypothetical protein [Bacteroidota bacterium]